MHYNGDNFLVEYYSSSYDANLGKFKDGFNDISPDFPSA